MALPVVKSAIDCATYSNTVSPYFHQLTVLPEIILDSIPNPVALRQVYLNTNPLVTAFAFCLFISLIFLIVSEINRNYSQVDRCWSILPTVLNLHYAAYIHLTGGLPTTRLDVLLAVSTLWSIRLTFNYWRKGGYNIGSEDYRWEFLRKYIKPALFFVFNVLFISLGQSVLLFVITMPTYVILLTSRLTSDGIPTRTSPIAPWTVFDVLFVAGMTGMVALSANADQEQWVYQSAKKEYLATAKVPVGHTRAELDRGFVTTGMWAYSRHPNFTAEQTFWVLLYGWSCYVTGSFWNWSGVGALACLALFQASTWLTELISTAKYPDYKLYQRHVGKFLPWSTVDWEKAETRQQAAAKKIDREGTHTKNRYDLR